MRQLDKDGNINEPTSARYGLPPDGDIKREKRLIRWSWLWLIMPMVGMIPWSIAQDELTDRWGHSPWWL